MTVDELIDAQDQAAIDRQLESATQQELFDALLEYQVEQWTLALGDMNRREQREFVTECLTGKLKPLSSYTHAELLAEVADIVQEARREFPQAAALEEDARDDDGLDR